MTYSNINKDKVQLKWPLGLKSLGLGIFLIVIILSSVNNIWQQWQRLNEAKKRIFELETQVKKLEHDNFIVEKQIQYATSSAYLQRAAREYLALGSPDDYWLIMPKDAGNNHYDQEITVINEIPTILQWLNLFTK